MEAAPLSLRRWERSTGTGPSWAIIWAKGKASSESCWRPRHSTTFVGSWLQGPLGAALVRGSNLVLCCLVKFAFQTMNCAWGKGLKGAWVWYRPFFSLAAEGAWQFTKIQGLSKYCVLVQDFFHLGIKTWHFAVFWSRLDTSSLSAYKKKYHLSKRRGKSHCDPLIWFFLKKTTSCMLKVSYSSNRKLKKVLVSGYKFFGKSIIFVFSLFVLYWVLHCSSPRLSHNSNSGKTVESQIWI